MKNIKFAFLNIKKNFQNAKELKSAFITSIIGMCINNISFIILWYYFGKTVGNLNGWEPFDIFGFNIIGMTGVILGSIFYSFPIAFLMLDDGFNYIDNSMYDNDIICPYYWRTSI